MNRKLIEAEQEIIDRLTQNPFVGPLKGTRPGWAVTANGLASMGIAESRQNATRMLNKLERLRLLDKAKKGDEIHYWIRNLPHHPEWGYVKHYEVEHA